MKEVGSLGELLRNKRIERKWSQETLAKKIPTTAQSISNYENELRLPDIYTFIKLKEVLGFEWWEIEQRRVQEDNEVAGYFYSYSDLGRTVRRTYVEVVERSLNEQNVLFVWEQFEFIECINLALHPSKSFFIVDMCGKQELEEEDDGSYSYIPLPHKDRIYFEVDVRTMFEMYMDFKEEREDCVFDAMQTLGLLDDEDDVECMDELNNENEVETVYQYCKVCNKLQESPVTYTPNNKLFLMCSHCLQQEEAMHNHLIKFMPKELIELLYEKEVLLTKKMEILPSEENLKIGDALFEILKEVQLERLEWFEYISTFLSHPHLSKRGIISFIALQYDRYCLTGEPATEVIDDFLDFLSLALRSEKLELIFSKTYCLTVSKHPNKMDVFMIQEESGRNRKIFTIDTLFAEVIHWFDDVQEIKSYIPTFE